FLIRRSAIPLASEVVAGNTDAQDGIENGFLFKLDREPFDPPVTVDLGAVIDFINVQLGGGDVSQNPGLSLVSQAFPDLNSSNFNQNNTTLVNIYEFSLNSTTKEFVFSFNLDVEGSDPNTGLIPFPKDFSDWLRIDSLSISFTAKSTSSTNS
ncbi:MAG: hypothetical protein AAFN68_06635, partial [Pseudomonadota bacterium]